MAGSGCPGPTSWHCWPSSGSADGTIGGSLAAGAASQYLCDLGTILGTAAVISLGAQRLHQPLVLGYLLTGVIVGPYVPGIVVADVELTHTLSEPRSGARSRT